MHQMNTVIDAWCQYDLDMDLDPMLCQQTELEHNVRHVPVPEYACPQFRFGRMNRYVQGAQPLCVDAVPIVSGEITERYIVAKEKRCPIIVVPNVQAPSTPFRHLINKTKDTVIPAPSDGKWMEFHPQTFVPNLADLNGTPRSAEPFDIEGQPIICRVELDIYDIANRMTIDRYQSVANLNIGPRSRASRLDGTDFKQSRLSF